MRARLQDLLTLFLLTCALGLGNFISTRHFTRWDLTETKRYTLSDATRDILDEVDDAITIKAYFTEEFPAALKPMRRDVEALLAEIKAEGRGLVTVEYLDPKVENDAELNAELEKLGIGSDPVQIIEQDQVQALEIHKSIVLYHADRKEVVPSLQGVTDLEYNIAVALKKLTLWEPPTVSFLGFKEGPSTFTDLAQLEPEVKKLYDVGTAVVTGGKPIESDNTTLMVVRPKGLSEAEAYQIDQFLLGGGKAIFAMDGMSVDMSQQPPKPEPVKTGLEKMLAAYGVKVEPSLVFDPSCETVAIQVRPGVQRPARYPPLVTAIYQNFNPESPIVSRISRIPFPWVSPITLTEAAREGKEVVDLISSTDQAWLPTPPIELAPDRIPPPHPTQIGQRRLAVALTGTFQSAWATGPPPLPEPDAKNPQPPHRTEGDTRIVLVGDSDFLMANFQSPGGLRFFMNAVDWLTLDDSLIRIRTKSAQARPLPKMDESEKRRFRWTVYLLAPVVVTGFGLARFWVRRRRQATA